MIKIEIPVRPVPYKRTTQKQKWVDKSYQKYLAFKELVQTYAKKQYKGEILDSQLKVNIDVYLSGKSTPMGRDGDIDNYIKSALDSLNKIIFKDDRQIVEVKGRKQPCYSGADKMIIEIEETSIN